MDKACDFVKFLDMENIDIFLCDEPVDKTATIDKPIISKVTEAESHKANTTDTKPSKKTADLSEIKSLEQLQQAIMNFDTPLKNTALNMVFAIGNSDSPKVMFIGEAPGQDEDIKGMPSVGKAGQLLDKMIKAINLTEEDFYITNVINYRPENSRTPTDEEVEAFLPFLKKHIELVKPNLICILGAVSLKAIFPKSSGITKSRGQWMEFQSIPTISTFHPAYLLRFPAKKKEAWEDLQELQKKLK